MASFTIAGEIFTNEQTESDPVDQIALTERRNVLQGLSIFKTEVMPGRGLIDGVYVPGSAIYTMLDFDNLLPVYTFLTAKFDIPERQCTEGLPTPTHFHIVENFAIRFHGQIFINCTGRYDFALIANDGAQLYIDGLLVVDHDGVHHTGGIGLTMGLHTIEICYFQRPRFHIALQWFYTPSGQPEGIVSSEIICHPGRLQAK